MRVERGAVGPVLDEDQVVRILDVVVHGVQQAARFAARSPDVLEAQAHDLVDRLGTGSDASGHDDHAPVVHPAQGQTDPNCVESTTRPVKVAPVCATR